MCSCCHGVSKYSSVIKSHLQHSHVNLSSRNVSKMVIPIRINSKYEKCFTLKINKKTLSQRHKNAKHKPAYEKVTVKLKTNQNISKSSKMRKVKGEKSILCTTCKKTFNSIGTYFSHLSAKDHLNAITSLNCTYCESQFMNLPDLINHNKKEHLMKRNLSATQLNCSKSFEDDVLLTRHSKLQCPYCPDIFNENQIEKLYQHLGDSHCGHIDLISIKTEEDDEGGSREQDTVIVAYKCQHCQECFLSLPDIIQHVTEKHVSSRQARKRKMPKWLQEYRESERKHVKKSRNDSICQKKLNLRDTPEDENRKASFSKRAKSHKEVNKKPLVVLQNINHYEQEEPSGKGKKSLQEAADNSTQSEQMVLISEDGNKTMKDMQIDVEKRKDVNETNDCNKVKDIIETDQKQNNASTTGLLKCPYCKSKEYHWLKSLKRHIRAKHPECVKENAEDQKEEQILAGENRSADEEKAYEDTLTADIINDEYEGDSDDDYIPEEDDPSESDTEKEKLSGPKTFKCKYCKGKVFPEREILQQHIKKQHPEVVVADQKKDQRSKHCKTNETEVTTKFKCPFCAFSLYHREYVLSHIEKVHSEVSHFTLADIIKKPAEINDNQSESECFQCSYCNYLCRWKSDLQYHCRSQHPTLKQPHHIPCILPSSWVDNQSILAKLKCAICNTVCEGKTNFENHMKDHVSDKRMNITFHGSLSEPDSIGKQQHGKKLTSFLCPFCDCVFKRKDSYIYHMKSHKGGTQKKEEIIAIKCVMLRKDLNILSTNHFGSSKNTAGNTYINTFNEGNVDDDNKVKGKGNEGNSNVDNVVSSSNLEDQDSDKLDVYIKTVNQYKEQTEEQSAMKGNLNIVHIKSASASENEKYLKPRLAGGSFICPVCDEFKTFSKSLAVKHVEDSHLKEMAGIDILYILPYVYVDIDKYSPEKDEFVFGCESCSLSTSSIVDAVKHIKSHRNELERKRSGTEEDFKTKIVEPKLFDMVSLSSSEFGRYEDITYKCWSCDPRYLLKTRKGYRKHMLTYHEDAVGCEVGDVMNQMLEVVDGMLIFSTTTLICIHVQK